MRLSVLFVSLALACSTPPAPSPSVPAVDPVEAVATGTDPVDTSRIVSLGAGVTEIVFALGAGDQVVAADASSQFPAPAGEKATLGYYRKVASEGILAQSPTLVLASDGTGPPTTLEQVEASGAHIANVEGAVTVEDARTRMRTLGTLLGKQDQAEALVAAMDKDLAAVQAAIEGEQAPRVLFIYARGGGTMMVAGDATSAKSMIEAAGGVSAVSGHEGFRPLTAEAVALAAPDVILLTTGGLESMGGVDGVLGAPGVSATPAGQSRRVLAVDDHLLLSMGPRTGEAVRTLAALLHDGLPDLDENAG